MPTLSVSIVVYEYDQPLLTKCIDSLRSAARRACDNGTLDDWQLTLVNNGDGILDSHTDERTSLTVNASNVGYGAAHNQAIEESHSDYHLILNPDVIMAEGLIVEAIQYLEGNPDVAMLGPAGRTPEGNDARLCKRYPTVLDLFLRGFVPEFLRRPFSRRLGRYEYHDLTADRPSEVELLSGCCLFARTETLQQVGGFDPSFFLYFEDYDLSLRMARFGRIMTSPMLTITHFGGNSAKKGISHIRWFCRSASIFFSRYGWRFV